MIYVNSRFLTQRITGVQRFAIELSRRLKLTFGDELKFVAPSDILYRDIAAEFNVEVIGKHTGYFWEQIELPIFLRKNGSPLLINFCSVAPLWYNNSIIAVHDITWVRYPRTYSKTFCSVYNYIIPRLCRNARHILTVSNFSLGEISGYYHIDSNKISVVYNAVDKSFHHVEDKKLKEEHYFISVSSIKENKNFPAVVDSFMLLKKKAADAKLYIIGDLSDKNFSNVNLNVEDCSDIVLLGRVSDDELIRYYSNAIAFIFPSYYEGFGIPVLEAQACGCPVIASKTSSLPEVLRESALLCSPYNAIEFADCMERLIDEKDLRTELIDKGKMNVERFSWSRSAKVVSDLCIKLLQK